MARGGSRALPAGSAGQRGLYGRPQGGERGWRGETGAAKDGPCAQLLPGPSGGRPPLRGSAPLPGSRRAPETGEAAPEVLVRAGRGKGGGTRGVAAAAGRSLGRRRHLVPDPPPPTQNAPGARPPLLHRAGRAGSGAGRCRHSHAPSRRCTNHCPQPVPRPPAWGGDWVALRLCACVQRRSASPGGRGRGKRTCPHFLLKGQAPLRAGGGWGFFCGVRAPTQPLRHRGVRNRDRGWSWVSQH